MSSKAQRSDKNITDEEQKTGSFIAQFEDVDGKRAGPQLDLPLGTTQAELQVIMNQLLENKEPVPYKFYVNDGELSGKVGESISEDQSMEQTIKIVYAPQAVFRVRAVQRCSSTLPGHAEAMLSSSFSPTGRVLATGAGDHVVRLWDVSSEMPKFALKAHKDWVLCIGWSPCGRFLVSGGKDGLVCVWTPESESPTRTIAAHKKWVNAVAWEPLHASPNASRFCSASKDGTCKIWDRVSGKCQATLSGHANSVCCVKWGGEGLIFTGSHDRSIIVWAVDGAKVVRKLEGHGHWVNCLSLNTEAVMRQGPYDHKGMAPEGSAERVAAARKKFDAVKGSGGELLASGSDDHTCFLWRPADGKKPIARLTGHVQLVNMVAFSPDGLWLASASFDGSVRLWHGPSGKFTVTLRGHVGAVYQLAWSADSRLLASGSKDSTVKVGVGTSFTRLYLARACRPIPSVTFFVPRHAMLRHAVPRHALPCACPALPCLVQPVRIRACSTDGQVWDLLDLV